MFIVFEGMDGAGKSTQIERLAQWMQHRGHQVTTCADPGSTDLGLAIREILLRREDIAICSVSEMLLFMTARAQMVHDVIRPALARNEIVICDRFALSTAVYQGFAGNLSVQEIWDVARIATHDLQPDLTLVFDLPVSELRSRLAGSADRMEARTDEYFAQVSLGYQTLAKQLQHTHLVDATQSVELLHEQICGIVESVSP